MRQFLIAWLICIAAHASEPVPAHPAIVVHHKSVLRWVDNNPAGSTAFYIVQVIIVDRVFATERIEKPEIEVWKLLRKASAGEYQLRILTVDHAGITSAPSEGVKVVWVGSGLS
jgi:hypothetical protein